VTSAGAGPVYVGPGDVISGGLAWFGMRAYSNAIAVAGTQQLAGLVRASDSNTCDIIVATSGGVGLTANCSTGGDNGSTLAAWCNATTCSVTTWYDQTGHSNNVVQATGADQPTITVSCSNSQPCLTFSAVQLMKTSVDTTSGTAQPLLLSIEAERTGNFTTGGNAYRGTGNNIILGGNSSTNSWFAYAGSTVATVSGITDSVFHAINVVYNGASTVFNHDGTEATLSPGSTGMIFQIQVGDGANWIGNIAEVGYWAGAKTMTERNNLCHNQRLYWGSTGTC
jgi:hypothetical protein